MKNKLYFQNAEDNKIFDNHNSFIKIIIIRSELIRNETKNTIPYNLQILLDDFPENNLKSINDIFFDFQTNENEFIYSVNKINNNCKHFLKIIAYNISLFFIHENFGSVTIPIEFNNFVNGKKWYYLTDKNKKNCAKLLIQIEIKVNDSDLKINRLINRNLNLSNNTKTTKTNTEPDIQSHLGKSSNFVSLNSNSLNNINFSKLNSNQNNKKSILSNEIIESNKNISSIKLIDNDYDNSSTIYNNDTGFYETSCIESLKKETAEKPNNIKSDFLKIKKKIINNISESEILEEIEIYEKNTINYINDMMFNIYNKDEKELNNKMNNIKKNSSLITKKSNCIKSLDSTSKYKKNKEKLVLQFDKFLYDYSKISTNQLFNYNSSKKHPISKVNKTCGNIQSKNINNNLLASINKKPKVKNNHNSLNINKTTRVRKIAHKNTNKKISSNNVNNIKTNKEKCFTNILSKNLLSHSQCYIKAYSKSSKKLIKNEANNKISQIILNYQSKKKKEEIFFFNKIWKKNDININQFNKCCAATNKSTDSYKKINFTNSFIYLTSANEKRNKKIFKHSMGINKDKNNCSQKQIRINKNNKIGNNLITELNEKRKKLQIKC